MKLYTEVIEDLGDRSEFGFCLFFLRSLTLDQIVGITTEEVPKIIIRDIDYSVPAKKQVKLYLIPAGVEFKFREGMKYIGWVYGKALYAEELNE